MFYKNTLISKSIDFLPKAPRHDLTTKSFVIFRNMKYSIFPV